MNRRGFLRGTIAGLLGCSMPAGLLTVGPLTVARTHRMVTGSVPLSPAFFEILAEYQRQVKEDAMRDMKAKFNAWVWYGAKGEP